MTDEELLANEEIRKLVDREINKVLQKVLDNAHGGGSWRRICCQLMREEKKIEIENRN